MLEQPILIIGASGAVGIPTIRYLVKRGATVRALTSSNQSANRLQELGVSQIEVGDFRLVKSLRSAMAGVDRVLFNPPRFTEDEAEIGLGVIAAARSSGIRRIVLNSVLHPELSDLPHHRNKLRVQEALLNADMEFVILQPAMFMQNIRLEWPSIINNGIYARPYSPHQKQSLIDTEDLGEAIACALIEDRLIGGTFELCSSERLSQSDMVDIICDVISRPVTAVERSHSEWESWARNKKWTPWAIDTYIKMCRHYDLHGYVGGNDLTLAAILGRKPTDYRTFLKRFAQEVSLPS